jgi:hypothetical protein
MSYPDLIEQDGRYWVTETNKTVARVHEVDKTLLEGLWASVPLTPNPSPSRGEGNRVARDGLVLDLGPEQIKAKDVAMPRIDLRQSSGVSLELWVRFGDLGAGQVLLDSRDAGGKGIALTMAEPGTLRLSLSDGQTKASWDCDADVLKAGVWHHIVAIVDAHPKLITFVVDGFVCNGGEARVFGWGRVTGDLGDVSGSGILQLAPSVKGELRSVRVYNRYLRTSEAMGNHLAEPRR